MKYIQANIKLFIIAAVCAFALACGNTANNTSKSKNANAVKAGGPTLPANAPPGAQPPNMLGSPTATVTIEEFADFQCPTCANVYGLMKTVLAGYGSQVKFIYRDFPLTQIHKNGYDAAVAAEAAGLQGKFWDMQNQLYTNQKLWADSADARTIFAEYAGKIGLDVEKFKNDSLGLEAKRRVDADLERGRAVKINSTPTIFVNGKQLAFEQLASVDTLKQAIDAELAKSGEPQTTAPATASNTSAANGAAEKPSNAAVK